MNQISAHIPAHWSAPMWLIVVALFALIGVRARWRVLSRPADLNVFLGATVAVLGFWQIKTGVQPGLGLHMLGATTLTLMFRPCFALLALTLLCAAQTALTGELNAYPANLLIMGAVPVGVSWAVFHIADRRLPNHMFVYIFVAAFFGAGLAIAAAGLAATLFAATAGNYAWSYLAEEYLPYYLLMAWAEALTTGMIVTLLVVYRPEWVATFDDRRYLKGK